MKKQILSFICALLLLIIFIPFTASAANGSVSLKTSASSVTVGSTVTVTVTYTSSTVGAGTAMLSYDDNVFQFDSLSGSGGTFNSNAAGLIKYTFVDSSQKSSYSFSCTFKAKQAGSCKFQLTSQDLMTFDEQSFTVGAQTVSVSAINPTKSANANLASIKPSSGTLTPKFSANVTNYTISVPYTTTSLSLSATTQDKNAKIAVSGKNALAVGKNTQIITVTAPNGTTKKYTVVINRSPNQTTSTSGTGTITTTTTPQEELLEVEVNGVTMTVSDTQPDATLPSGFSWTHVTIHDISVSAAVNNEANVTLVYLTDTQAQKSGFYMYDAADGTFAPFRQLTVIGGSYILRELPAGFVAPTGAVKGVYAFGNDEVSVYQFEDAALADIVLVYATSVAGKTGLYSYDKTDGSMQLYRTITVAADVPPDTNKPAKDNPLASFFVQHRQVILICAAVFGGVVLVIATVLLVSLATRKDKNCKH